MSEKKTMDVRMSTSGTRLMFPCAVNGAAALRRFVDRWNSEAISAQLT
jgi:hypothetical protein